MTIKPILLIDRCLNKVKRVYRKSVFRAKTGCDHKSSSLVGDVRLINTNIKLGKNVL